MKAAISEEGVCGADPVLLKMSCDTQDVVTPQPQCYRWRWCQGSWRRCALTPPQAGRTTLAPPSTGLPACCWRPSLARSWWKPLSWTKCSKNGQVMLLSWSCNAAGFPSRRLLSAGCTKLSRHDVFLFGPVEHSLFSLSPSVLCAFVTSHSAILPCGSCRMCPIHLPLQFFPDYPQLLLPHAPIVCIAEYVDVLGNGLDCVSLMVRCCNSTVTGLA